MQPGVLSSTRQGQRFEVAEPGHAILSADAALVFAMRLADDLRGAARVLAKVGGRSVFVESGEGEGYVREGLAHGDGIEGDDAGGGLARAVVGELAFTTVGDKVERELATVDESSTAQTPAVRGHGANSCEEVSDVAVFVDGDLYADLDNWDEVLMADDVDEAPLQYRRRAR